MEIGSKGTVIIDDWNISEKRIRLFKNSDSCPLTSVL